MFVCWLDPVKDTYVRAGEEIVFKILEIKRNRVKVGVIAPPSVGLLRERAEAKRGLVKPDSAD